jgi:hypothetical protein
MAVKKIKLKEKATSEILELTLTQNQVLRLAMLKTNLRRRRRTMMTNQSGGGLLTWGMPQGRNTNFHPFVSPAKGVRGVNGSWTGHTRVNVLLGGDSVGPFGGL